jgi:hypothetical protein
MQCSWKKILTNSDINIINFKVIIRTQWFMRPKFGCFGV